jgi:molybdopterin-guanine dinucleotide biosynthesis protein A
MRMGTDKTLLRVDGEQLVSRVVDAAASVCAHVLLITNQPEMHSQVSLAADVRILTDEVPFLGPLGGLVTALAQSSDEWVLAVAADMPWLEPEVVRVLWSLRGEADVVIPVGDRGTEPLLALYRTATCLPAGREALGAGYRRLIAMFPALEVVEVPADTLRAVDSELRSLVNVNTPEELAEVRSSVGAGRRPGAVAPPNHPHGTDAPAEERDSE